MRNLLVIAIVCSVVLAASPFSYAREEHSALTKLGDGLVNLLTGWMEIPRQIDISSKSDSPTYGVVQGLIRGIAYTILRTGSGALDAVTFFVPPYDKPLMQPVTDF